MASKGYASVDEYVQDILAKIDAKDESLTTLKIDEFHYPLCGVAARKPPKTGCCGPRHSSDSLDAETIASLLTRAQSSPHIRSLELRFIEFSAPISQAFQSLLLVNNDDVDGDNDSQRQLQQQQKQQKQTQEQKKQQRHWESISIMACSGLTSDDFCALASVLDRCHTLRWHHNHSSFDSLGTLGRSLTGSNSTSTTTTTNPTPTTFLKELYWTRETLKGDSARALLDPLGSNVNLEKLVFNFCWFDDHGIDALATALSQNSNLQHLDLGACHLNDAQVEKVVLALSGHPTLRYLVLTLNGCNYRGSRAVGKLLEQPGCKLEYLILSHQTDETNINNNLATNNTTTRLTLTPRPTTITSNNGTTLDPEQRGIVFVQPIAQALTVNTSLKWLSLSRNRLQTNDVSGLFHTLMSNKTLEVLDLNSNDISDDENDENEDDDEGGGKINGVMKILANSLQRSQGLRELHLLKNNIRSPSSFAAFLKALKESRHQTLEVLELRSSLSSPSSLSLSVLLPYLSAIRYNLALNASGRRILSRPINQVPLGLWPKLLERATKPSHSLWLLGWENRRDQGNGRNYHSFQQQEQGLNDERPKHEKNPQSAHIYRHDALFHLLQDSAVLSQR